MKYGIFAFLSLLFISTSGADVWLDLYEPDGVTPYNGHPIMVGQSLVVVVISDEAEFVDGQILLEGDDPDLGELQCRTSEDLCDDSILPAAQGLSEGAFIGPTASSEGIGYGFWTDDDPFAGEWFILDYTATNIGDPNIALYANFSLADRTDEIPQVRSRDFDDDGGVNLGDLAIIAEYWLSSTCAAPDWCGQADLNLDNSVDVLDLAAFTEFWLEETG